MLWRWREWRCGGGGKGCVEGEGMGEVRDVWVRGGEWVAELGGELEN